MIKKLLLTVLFVLSLVGLSFAANPFQYPLFQAIDADGNPVLGGLVYTYEAGTTTNKVAYTDYLLTVPASNPIQLDSKGEATFYLSGTYKINVTTATGVQVDGFPIDNVFTNTEPISKSLERNYGCDLPTALADLGIVNQAELNVDCECTIADGTSETIAKNIFTKFVGGGKFKGVAGGGTESLTINGGMNPGNYERFDENLNVKIAPITWERPVEWFGAAGDGVTNDYDAVLAALISCSVQNGGGKIVFNGQKTYVLNNGANPAFKFNADELPDGTDTTTWAQNTLPVFEIDGTVSQSPTFNRIPPSIKITGTGKGIEITGGTHKWRGNLHIRNLYLLGNGTASIGIDIDYLNRYNTFENVEVHGFTSHGWYIRENNTFATQFVRCRSTYNGGWGWVIDGNAQDFYSCTAETNGAGGVALTGSQVNSVNWYGGMIQFNAIPQIKITAARSVNFDGVYIEGQDDFLNGSEVTGEGKGIFQLGTGTETLYNMSFNNIRIVPGTPTSDTYKEQFIFDIDANVIGLTIDNVYLSSFANTFDNYVINDASAMAITQAKYTGVYWSGGSFTDDFEAVDMEKKFNVVETRATDVFKIKSMLPFCQNFSRDNLADDTAGQILSRSGTFTTTDRIYIPWNCSLVGMSWYHNASTGTITVTEDTLTGSYSEEIAGTSVSGSVTYAIGEHTLSRNASFNPKVTTASLTSATRDITVVFFFAVDIDEQDRN